MGKLWYKWPLAFGLVIGWTFAWTSAWRSSLFERSYREPGPGITVFTATEGDLRVLWIAAGVGLVLASLGVSFLVLRGIFGPGSPQWDRVWLVVGSALTLLGLSLPILYPSATSLVVDEPGEIVSLERRWLYAEAADALAFSDIKKVNLRVERRLLRIGNEEACQVGRGFSIVGHDRTRLEIPGEFANEEVAVTVAGIAGALLEQLGATEC